MKSWRTRLATGLAVGAAAIIVPLTASPASAVPPWDPSYHVVGGMTYDSFDQCMDEEAIPGKQVWCDGPENGPAEYTIWVK